VLQLGVAAAYNAFSIACAPPARYESPGTLGSYDILITRHDSLGRELAQGLRRRGFTVRTRVKGGSRPTAYLFTFTFPEADATWLHVRLADTRTGAVVAAVSAPLDSLGATAAAQAHAIADALAASAALRHPPLPPS
jgi:hypothetical protein